MSVTVRDATQDDLPSILEIDGAAFLQPWSAQSFQAALDDPARSLVIVVERESRVCGFGVAWHVGSEGEIATLAVDEAQRGHKIGETVLHALLEKLAARGVTQIFLEVRPSNAEARRLYEKIGFSEVGVRKNYYVNGEDAIVMKKGMWETGYGIRESTP